MNFVSMSVSDYHIWYGDWCIRSIILNNRKYIEAFNRYNKKAARYWVDEDGSLYLKDNFGLKKYDDTDYIETAIRKVFNLL